jgi:tetratricopeptide (TPR) repeat protein
VAVGWAERALGEAKAANDRVAMARAYDSLDWANLSLGRPTGTYWRNAMEIYQEVGDLRGESGIALNLGAGLFYQGEWNEALVFYDRARQGRFDVGDPVTAALASDNGAEILCERGELEEAEARLRDSLRVWKAAGNRFMLGACFELLARVAARAGRLEDALGFLRDAKDAYVAVGAREDELGADAREAEFRVVMGAASEALALADVAAERAQAEEGEGLNGSLIARVRGYALAQLHRDEEARAAFEEGVRVARTREEPYDVALSLIGLARLQRARQGTFDDAALEEASAIIERLGVIAVPAIPI